MSSTREKIKAQTMAFNHKPCQSWHRHLVSSLSLEELFRADQENRYREMTLATLCDIVLGENARDRSDDALIRGVRRLASHGAQALNSNSDSAPGDNRPAVSHVPPPVSSQGLITLYTDGSCLSNPGGPGGWAVIAVGGGRTVRLSGHLESTTNNIAEITAGIKALEFAPFDSKILVVTDSRYLKDGMTSWVFGWKRRGWRTGSGDPVKNKDLWVRLDELARDRDIQWAWVPGHGDNHWNNECDALALTAAKSPPPAPATTNPPSFVKEQQTQTPQIPQQTPTQASPSYDNSNPCH